MSEKLDQSKIMPLLGEIIVVYIITRVMLNWNGRLNWNDGVYLALASGRMFVKRYFMNDN